ncbi:MAG: type II secretion system secretin GspD [Steroidobacteraceae bacterium]|nr:type II secretion system secretin GspD [Steroidobacteraceae bacterium]MDW8260112.1 type II secretion system secretin GspD [Gammaproteobacteria bacterium]
MPSSKRDCLAETWRLLAAVAAALFATAGVAQQSARITPNFKDADITQVIEAVSAATGKNIIIDPRVRAQVTMLSTTPMSPEAFYEAFQALLQVHGFVAVPSGNVVKVIPDANARTAAANDLPARVSRSSDEMVTQIVTTKNVAAAQLVPILRPLLPQYAHLVAYPPTNVLVISDRANNVNRLMRIIERIDQTSDSDFDIVPLQNASAAEIVRVMGALIAAQAQGEGASPGVRLVADDRTNSVLLSGDRSQVLKYKARIAFLDQPLESGGDTQVRYLQYADAEKMAAKLKEQLSGVTAAATPGAGGAAAIADRSAVIWAEPETNALVITAPPKTMRSLMSVVDRLDIRRAQVHVQALIVEVSADKAADLGVNWVAVDRDDDIPAGGFIEPIGGTSIVDLARAVDNPASLTSVPRGTTIGIGRLRDSGVNFAAIIRAIRGDASTNIIAEPSVTVLDNQEAQIKVTQEVPFITGQFTNTGANQGAVNPFQTIQRQEVGTILKITPQINVGDQVTLKIEQESSSLAASSAGAVDLITNKRTVTTTVIIEDQGTVVLGGLIQDRNTKGEQRVPFLGRIPLIGEAFRVRSARKEKTNLLVFIQPRILRDGTDAAITTYQKYNYVRDEQRKLAPRGEVLPLLRDQKNTVLPPLPEPRRAPPATEPERSPPANDAQSEPPRDPAAPESVAPQPKTP